MASDRLNETAPSIPNLRPRGADAVHHEAREDGERLEYLDDARQPEAVHQSGLVLRRLYHLGLIVFKPQEFFFVKCYATNA